MYTFRIKNAFGKCHSKDTTFFPRNFFSHCLWRRFVALELHCVRDTLKFRFVRWNYALLRCFVWNSPEFVKPTHSKVHICTLGEQKISIISMLRLERFCLEFYFRSVYLCFCLIAHKDWTQPQRTNLQCTLFRQAVNGCSSNTTSMRSSQRQMVAIQSMLNSCDRWR